MWTMKATTIAALAVGLTLGCQSEDVGPAERVMLESQVVVDEVNEGLWSMHDEADVPFGDVVEGYDSSGGGTPGSPEIGSGGTGSPELSSGGTGGAELPSGGGGSPIMPQGGPGSPGGAQSFTAAACDFVDAICELVVRCAPEEFAGTDFSCADLQAICIPLFQEIEAEFGGPVPSFVISYLQCVTDAVRSASCSLFDDQAAGASTFQACLPQGFESMSSDF